MKKILYYLVPLATAFLLCGCLKDMKDGELLHGNREVLISIDLPGELASLDKSGFKVTMRNTKIGNTYISETDAKGETRIDAEYAAAFDRLRHQKVSEVFAEYADAVFVRFVRFVAADFAHDSR